MALKMTSHAKRKTLILLGLVMIITVIVAASLPQLILQPGMPLPRAENNQLVITPFEEGPLVAITVNKFVKVLVSLLLAGSILFLLYKMTRGISWKDLASYLLPILASISIVSVFLFLLMLFMSEPQESTPVEMTLPTATPLEASPLGPVPPLLLWLVGIGLLVMSILVAIWIFSSSSRRPLPIELVGLEAEKAWQALKTGLDLKGVIVQCYRQMSLALEQDQGVERKEWMTTREFENLLEAEGIPHDPIHQLTQLFEAVRYGDWQPNPADEQKAIHCLQDIMLHSREAKNSD